MNEAAAKRVWIVGAGPAGLAVGACLRAFGVSATLVESGAAPGWSWLERYDSLRLHTTRRDSRLPGLAMSDGGDRYPTSAEYAAYCARYARAFALDLRLGVEVRAVRRREQEWSLDTSHGEERARVVVLATGRHRTPSRPHIAGEEGFRGELLHSSDYRNGARFRGRRVLVVGAGNTAMDLLLDLDAHGARPALAIRGAVHWTARDRAGLNWHWRHRLGLEAPLALARRLPPALAGPACAGIASAAAGLARRRFASLARGARAADGAGILREIADQRPPTVLSAAAFELLRRETVAILPELVGLEDRAARFADGQTPLAVDAVVFATGFRAEPSALLDGPPENCPDLFFCGRTPLLSSIRREAPRLAREIAAAAAR